MLRWNISFIFKTLGDTQGIVQLCAEGHPGYDGPARATVAVWKHRGRVSAEWLPVLVAELLSRGVDPNDLFEITPAPALAPADVGL